MKFEHDSKSNIQTQPATALQHRLHCAVVHTVTVLLLPEGSLASAILKHMNDELS
jgi:hypothetical protein